MPHWEIPKKQFAISSETVEQKCQEMMSSVKMFLFEAYCYLWMMETVPGRWFWPEQGHKFVMLSSLPPELVRQ